MKNASFTALFIIIAGLLCFLGLPWWALVPIAAIAGFLFSQSAAGAYAAGFVGGSLLWYGVAFWADSMNGGVFSAKIGAIFLGLQGWHLLSVTGFLGGLLGGFGAMTGRLARELLTPPSRSKRRQTVYPRRRR
jgi:hypothetical protein